MARPRPALAGKTILEELHRDYTGRPGDGAPAGPPEPPRATAERVLALLAERGVPVEATLRRRVLACRDGARLGRWLARAAVLRTAAELDDD